MKYVSKIISGGQTGADRGGLDAAIQLRIPHGGWCPKGRRAEDGRVPERYQLQETGVSTYAARTKLNVIDADATLVFVRGVLELGSGSAVTVYRAKTHRKMHAVIDVQDPGAAGQVRAFLCRVYHARRAKNPDVVVNIAGSRESSAPGIQAAVERILIEALS